MAATPREFYKPTTSCVSYTVGTLDRYNIMNLQQYVYVGTYAGKHDESCSAIQIALGKHFEHFI